MTTNITRQQASNAIFARLEQARSMGVDPPRDREMALLGIAAQTLSELRSIARARVLSPDGTRAELLSRIKADYQE